MTRLAVEQLPVCLRGIEAERPDGWGAHVSACLVGRRRGPGVDAGAGGAAARVHLRRAEPPQQQPRQHRGAASTPRVVPQGSAVAPSWKV